MTNQRESRLKWWYLAVLFGLVLTAGIFATAVSASGSRVSQVNANPITGAPAIQTVDARMFFTPGVNGTCAPPPNGGSVAVGCTFVLDLMVDAGTNAAPDGLSAAQAYINFTYQVISNARVSTIGAGCTPTNTLTTDLAVLDANLQNEVCTISTNCTFRGTTVPPGSLAYASGALSNCPNGCPDPEMEPPFNQPVFRIAQMGICANNPGQATLRWDFNNDTPPNDRCGTGAPSTRDTELVTISGALVQDCTRFVNYTFCVGPPGSCTVGTTPTASSTSIPTQTSTLVPTLTPTRTNTSSSTSTVTATRTNTVVAVTNTPTPFSTPTPGGDAFIFLTPGTAGSCPAPANGGTTQVGCSFVLDLMVNAGSRADASAQQSYLTYTFGLIKNARVSDIASCTLTSTVTADLTTFDATLQNEVCNGPNPCNFRGTIVDPGSFAFASGALSNPETGGIFRVAQVGLCAVAPGTAVLHWEFSPPSLPTRDSQVVAINGDIIHNRALFTDYVINITGGGGSPTVTLTPPALTVTSTSTSVPTASNTSTPVSTFTAVPPTLTTTPTRTNTSISTSTSTATLTGTNTAVAITNTPTITPVAGGDAFIFLTPGTAGSCPAPPNGGTTQVGCSFILDLIVNTGSRNDATAQQSYLTFTYQLIQNVRISSLPACVPTNTVTGDLTIFDASLQNEVCNGPSPCVFRGLAVEPGSFAYASGALSNCETGCGGTFRVAQVGICAVAPGTAVLHWQFSPPAPTTRDTEVVAINGDLIHNPALFTDYVFNIVGGATATVTVTATPVLTATGTSTFTPTSTTTRVNTHTSTTTPTSTFTDTPTSTFTPSTTSTSTPVATNTSTATGTNSPTNTATITSTETSTRTGTTVPATRTTTPTVTETPIPPTRTFTAIRTNTLVPTATSTRTGTNTRTRTSTVAPATNTRTRTATPQVTGTPCDECHIKFEKPARHRDAVELYCNPDGTLHWTASLLNKPDRDEDPGCTLVLPYRVSLQLKCRGGDDDDDDDGPNQSRCAGERGDGWVTVQVQRGTAQLPARQLVTFEGDFCYHWPSNADRFRVEFALDSHRHGCNKKKKSHDIRPCPTNPTCPPSAPLFPDVPSDYVFADNIQLLADTGIVSGFIDGTFRPNAPINRGQVAKMVVIANGITNANGEGGTEQHFSDVPTDHPYYSYIQAAFSQGLVGGYSDGTYRPYDNVTRGQIAKIVVQAQYLELVTPDMPTFSDVAKDNVFYSYIETAYAHGILSGYADGTFGPNDTATRGQVSKIVSNVLFENE